jgi:hypothetical protein
MRDLLKVVLLSSINAENRIKTKQAIQHEINWDKNLYQWSLSKKLDLNDILDKFVSTHAPIKEYFFSGKGIELQNTDSRIAEMVVNHCTRHHIPVLCIHDSFVIEQRHKQLLQDIMNKSFEVVLKEFLTTGSIATSKLKIEEYNQPKQESVRRVLTIGNAKPIPQDVINQLNQITREKRIVMWKPKMKMLIDFDRWNVEDDDYDNLLRKRDKEYILRKKLHNRIEWEKNYYKDSYRDCMKEV